MLAVLPGLAWGADYRDRIGWTSLKARLGASAPSGSGIPVMQVEATDGSGNYSPQLTHAEFSGKVITLRSGSSGTSSHATTVGRYYYGATTSIAAGISSIDAFRIYNNTDDWLGTGFLRTGLSSAPLIESPVRRTQNHSWAGSFGVPSTDNNVLRRIDLVVERDGVLVTAGLPNTAGGPIPALMGSAYNVLTVGLSNSKNSYGATSGSVDGPGRIKPNLVVPIDSVITVTSYAAPVVAASGALLFQIEGTMGLSSPNAEALVARSLLMAGCVKDGLTDPAGVSVAWRKGFATPSVDGTVPFDYRYGAGALRIDNSYRILKAGKWAASSSSDVPLTGWDYGTVVRNGPKRYFLEVPSSRLIKTASVVLHWNRKVTGSPPSYGTSLANLDLGLYSASGFTKDAQLDLSVSTVDNVEHIFRRDLGPGRYLLEVSSGSSVTREYAIAWDFRFTPVGPDFNGDDYVDVTDLAHFQFCASGANETPPAGCTDADLDDDGDVDQSDFGLFQRCISGVEVVNPGC